MLNFSSKPAAKASLRRDLLLPSAKAGLFELPFSNLDLYLLWNGVQFRCSARGLFALFCCTFASLPRKRFWIRQQEPSKLVESGWPILRSCLDWPLKTLVSGVLRKTLRYAQGMLIHWWVAGVPQGVSHCWCSETPFPASS